MISHICRWTCVVGFAFRCALLSANTIYVDLNQTVNPEDGKSWATAWDTIAEGVDNLAVTNAVLQGGYTVCVNAGTYPQQTVTFTIAHSGISSASNVFLANGVVDIQGNSTINMASNSYFTIDGFSMGRILGDTGTNITIRNCVIRPWANRAGVKFVGDSAARHAENVRISRCKIVGSYDGNYGILFTYLDSGIIENCTVVGMGSYGMRAWSGSFVVKNCIIADCGYGGCQKATVLSNNCIFANAQANVMTAVGVGCNTEEEINALPNCGNNIVANPGFSDLANNWNVARFYENSPCLNAGTDGLDIGACENPVTDPISTNVYYVKPDGNDGSDGLSVFSAWATIPKAAVVAVAGDMVRVQSGIYTNSITITNGGSGSLNVTYLADGDVVVTNANINLTKVAGIVLDGFECTRAVKLVNAFGNTIRNGSVHDSSDDGVYLEYSNGNLIENMRLFNNSRHGIYGLSRVGNSYSRCSIYNNSSHGMALGVAVWEPCSLSHIWNCNIYSNGDCGVQIGNSYTYVILKQDVANCDIIGNGGHGVYLSSASGATPAFIRNCIIQDNIGGGIWEGHAASDAFVSNTCFNLNNGTNFYDEAGAVRDTQADINAATGCGSNIVANPRFSSPGNATDCRLLPDSPCVDAGVEDVEVAVDFYGRHRPVGPAYDIGSYEVPPSGSVLTCW